MLQFYREDSGLDLVDARVAAKVIKDVFLCGTVVAEGLDGLGEFIVVGGHSASITHRTKILARIERMTCSIAKSARFFKGKHAAVGLGIVLDEFQAVLTANLPYPIRIGTAAVEMDNHDGSGTRGDGLLDKGIVNLKRGWRGLYEDGLEAVLGNGENRGDKGIGGHDDFIALLHHPHLDIGSQNQR